MTPLDRPIADTVAVSLTLMLQGVEEGAVETGLSIEMARAFARQALVGATSLLLDTSVSPASLKDRVASPGGTTIMGIAALEGQAVRGMLLRTVRESALRTDEGSNA